MTRSGLRSTCAAAALLAAGVLCACHRVEEVRIGFVGELATELGVGGRNGAELAVTTLNAGKGVHYELLVEDDRNDPRVVQSAIASFADRGAAFVVGPMTSTMAVAAVPQADRLRMVLISPTATTDELTGKDDYFFRTGADARTGARQLALALHGRGLRSAVILMDAANASYSSSFGHAMATAFMSFGDTRTQELEYRSGKSLDFSDALTNAGKRGPDVVVLVGSPTDAGIASQHLRHVLPGVVIALSPWGANAQYLQVAGRAGEGTVALRAADLESSRPQMQDFIRRYQARFGEPPTTPAVQSYEAVMLGAGALGHGGVKALQATLSAPGPRAGLDSDFEMDAHGDIQRAVLLSEVRNGRFERVDK